MASVDPSRTCGVLVCVCARTRTSLGEGGGSKRSRRESRRTRSRKGTRRDGRRQEEGAGVALTWVAEGSRLVNQFEKPPTSLFTLSLASFRLGAVTSDGTVAV